MPLGRHRHPVGQPGGEHGPLPERRAPADREAAGLGRRGRVAAQGWPPVRGRVLIEGFVAVPLEVGAFRRDEYAGLLTPSRWRRPCIAPPHFLRVARGCPQSRLRLKINPLATSKLGLHLQKAGVFDVDGWISPCSRHGRVVLDEGREGRIPPATLACGFPADYNHTSPPDGEDLMPDPDL